jgi:hypothetical protein
MIPFYHPAARTVCHITWLGMSYKMLDISSQVVIGLGQFTQRRDILNGSKDAKLNGEALSRL